MGPLKGQRPDPPMYHRTTFRPFILSKRSLYVRHALFGLLCPVLAAWSLNAEAWQKGALLTLENADRATLENSIDLGWLERNYYVPTVDEARVLYRLAMTHAKSERYRDAASAITIVIRSLPRVSDHLRLLRAEWLYRAQDYAMACPDYQAAMASQEPSLIVRGEVGYVRCKLHASPQEGIKLAPHLLKKYPRLPWTLQVRVDTAQAYIQLGRYKDAVALYHQVDKDRPESSQARIARARLKELEQKGIAVPHYDPNAQVERIGRLARLGAMMDAHELFTALLATPKVPPWLFQRARTMIGHIDTKSLGGVPPMVAVDESTEEMVTKESLAERRLRITLKSPALNRQSPARLLSLLRQSVDLNYMDGISRLVDAVLARKKTHAELNFEVAMHTAGLVSEKKTEALLRPIITDSRLKVAAHYHLGRSLERQGRTSEAKIFFQTVLSMRTDTYYMLWAEQRLQSMNPATATTLDQNKTTIKYTGEPLEEKQPELDPKLLERIGLLASRLEDGYPWLSRAHDLARLGLVNQASDELFYTYQVWRQSHGMKPRPAGLMALARGRVSMLPMTRAERLVRKKLDRESTRELSDFALALGDVGTAYGFGGDRGQKLPRAYAAQLEAAAMTQNLDPNLLFGLMRVESVYQKRILSRVGAVGLGQIMPVTGRAIAAKMGFSDFSEDMLLNPSINLKFSAWYVARLLSRFRGSLPLTLASYNGGPHNVERWLRQTPRHIPLDVFLETIPFTETRRYVRRVLTYYAAYARQQGTQIPRLNLALPHSTSPIINF